MKQQDLQNNFTKLIRENERIIHKVCFLYAGNEPDRHDLFQEIVFNAWKSYPKFRGAAKFSTWLYQVALNTALTGFRKEKRAIVSYMEQLPEMNFFTVNSEENEQLEILYKAIDQLSEVEKALVMLYLDGKSYEEMATIIGLPGGALRVRMTRIKDKLRTITKNKA